MSAAEPQRVATWILAHCTSDYQRESLLGDLREQYEDRGGWWYWRQALSAVRTHIIRVVVTAAERPVQAAEFIGDLIMWVALGLCALIQLPIYADLLISWTPLVRSEPKIIVVTAMIAAALVVAAATVHGIRARRLELSESP
jgi:hypothetical protein